MQCIKCDAELKDEFIYCPYCGKKQKKETAVPGRDYPLPRRKNGTGSIRYMRGKNNPYQVRIMKNGVRISLGSFPTLTQAQACLNGMALDIVSDRINCTLGDIWKSYTSSSAYTDLSDKGKEGMDTAWTRLSVLQHCRMRELSRSDYQHIIDTAMKMPRYKIKTEKELQKMKPSAVARYEKLIAQPPEPLSYASKHKIQVLVSILCQEAMGDNIIGTNYGELLSIKNAAPKIKRRNLTEEEISNIMDAAIHSKDKNLMLSCQIIMIFTYTGMRANELLRLPKEAVCLENRTLRGGSKTEAGKDRLIPIHPCIFPFICAFLMAAPRNSALITKNGQSITYDHFVDSMFFPALSALNIQYQDAQGNNIITLHRTRHTFTQRSIERGIEPEALKKIMGHTKISTTIDKYDDIENAKYLSRELDKL